MNKLKFSHDYKKLPLNWHGTQAVLLSVTRFNLSVTSKKLPEFIRYDTEFRGEAGLYALDFEHGMILVFIHLKTGLPFTTLRRWTTEKHAYYSGNIGKEFILVDTRKEASGR